MASSWRVICSLPNASGSINGVSFHRTRMGMLSDVIPEGVARQMARIAGYQLVVGDASGRLLVGHAARTRRPRAGGTLWSPDVFAPREAEPGLEETPD